MSIESTVKSLVKSAEVKSGQLRPEFNQSIQSAMVSNPKLAKLLNSGSSGSSKPPKLSGYAAVMGLSQSIEYESSSQLVSFDVGLADRMINLPSFVGERPLRQSHVDELVCQAKRGEFLLDQASFATCSCTYDNTLRRINGQHTAWMRKLLGNDVPKNWGSDPKIKVVKYVVDTEDDFRRLYTKIDRGAPRTSAHVTTARLLGLPVMGNMQRSYIDALSKGLKVFLGDERISADAVADLMTGQYNKLVLKVADFMLSNHLSCNKFDHVRRAPVYGAMLATFNVAAGDSQKFWDKVIYGDMLRKTDSEFILREWLGAAVIKRHGETTKGTIMVTSEDVYRVCIMMWNAFRLGKICKRIQIPRSRPGVK